jgi:hypothetical protein
LGSPFKINLGLDSLIINMDEHKIQFSVKSTKIMRERGNSSTGKKQHQNWMKNKNSIYHPDM